MLNGLFDIDNRLDYLTENGDMLPRLKELPPLPDNNMKYELRLNHNGVLVQNLGPENKQNSGANRLDYLKDSICAETLKTSLLSAGFSHSILQHDTASDLEFLFGIYQGNANPPGIFRNHFIVRYSGVYYDPSYGSGGFPSSTAHEEASIDGICIVLSSYQVAKKKGTSVELSYNPTSL